MANHRAKFGWCWIACLASLILFSPGCDSSPTTHPVSGKVVNKRGKAMTGGTITFLLDKDPTLSATGAIQKDGSFSLTTHYVAGNNASSKVGAPSGEYSVTVEPAYGDELPNAIKGNSVSKKFTVSEGENNFVVEVE